MKTKLRNLLIHLLSFGIASMVAASAAPVLEFSSYIGGSAGDAVNAIAVDQFGNAYVTGVTFSPELSTKAALDPTFAGARDIFVRKYDTEGNLVFATFLGDIGPSGSDSGWASL